MPTRAITVTAFDGFTADLMAGLHTFGTDDIRAMLVTAVPAASTATNAALTEVTGANYTAGGMALSATLGGVAPQSILQTAVDTLWSENASGFTDAAAVVVRNATSGRLIAFADIRDGATVVDSTVQDVDVNWANGGDIVSVG